MDTTKKQGQIEPRTFEECQEEIAAVVERKRYDWTFKADLMMDFDDVKVMIMTHIWKKWDTYDQTKSLGAWVNIVTKHQFINILRDVYTSTVSPCNRCLLNKGQKVCAEYGNTECLQCPLYLRWYNTKRHSHAARLPLPLDSYVHELSNPFDNAFDVSGAVPKMHDAMKKVLRNSEWEIYKRLFIEHKSEEETAIELDLTSNDKSHKVKNKRIRQVKAIILAKAKEILKEGLSDAF